MDAMSGEVSIHFSDSWIAVADRDLFFFREGNYATSILIDLSTCI